MGKIGETGTRDGEMGTDPIRPKACPTRQFIPCQGDSSCGFRPARCALRLEGQQARLRESHRQVPTLSRNIPCIQIRQRAYPSECHTASAEATRRQQT